MSGWKVSIMGFFLDNSGERLKVGGIGGDRGWDGWMASPAWWTWVWVSSGSWWWTVKPGVLQSMGSQRALNWTGEEARATYRLGSEELGWYIASSHSSLQIISIFDLYRGKKRTGTYGYILKMWKSEFCILLGTQRRNILFHLWNRKEFELEEMSFYCQSGFSMIVVLLQSYVWLFFLIFFFMSDSFATPWTVSHQVSLSTGFPRQEYWSGLPFPSPRDLPNPEMEPVSPVSPALTGVFFYHWVTWAAPSLWYILLMSTRILAPFPTLCKIGIVPSFL